MKAIVLLVASLLHQTVSHFGIISKERGRGASCDIMGMLPKWPLGNNHVLPGCCGFLPKEG